MNNQAAQTMPEPITASMCPSSDYAKGWNDCLAAMLATAPAASGGEPPPAASVSEWAREIMEVIDSWMSRFDHSRASTCSEHQSETKWELDRSRIQSALEQALTQQRGSAADIAALISLVAELRDDQQEDEKHAHENGGDPVTLATATVLRIVADKIQAIIDTTPQPGAEALRELVQRWRKELDRSSVSNDDYSHGFDVAKATCCHELESLLGRGGK